MKRVYIIAGVIFILVFMVWELGRICYNVDLDSLLKKTENSLLDTSQEKNQYLNYQIIMVICIHKRKMGYINIIMRMVKKKKY